MANKAEREAAEQAANLSADQLAALGEEADAAEEVTLVLESTTVNNFVTYSTRKVELLDPTKKSGQTVEVEAEYPIVITREGTRVPASLVGKIREAAQSAGLIVNEKD